jgi:hypothetical protein
MSLQRVGRYASDASNNVGSGCWSNAASPRTKTLALATFEMYEFHTTQEGTQTHPGQTFDLDYSLERLCDRCGGVHRIYMAFFVLGAGEWVAPSLSPIFILQRAAFDQQPASGYEWRQVRGAHAQIPNSRASSVSVLPRQRRDGRTPKRISFASAYLSPGYVISLIWLGEWCARSESNARPTGS